MVKNPPPKAKGFKSITNSDYKEIAHIADELIQRNNSDYEKTYKTSGKYLARYSPVILSPQLQEIASRVKSAFPEERYSSSIDSIIACMIELPDSPFPECQAIRLSDKTSFKLQNIKLSLIFTLESIFTIRDIRSDFLAESKVVLLKIFLYTIRLLQKAEIKLSDSEVEVIFQLYKCTKGKCSISEDELIEKIIEKQNNTEEEAFTKKDLSDAITELESIHCVSIENGKVQLLEKVYI